MPLPRCFGFSPLFKLSKEQTKKIKAENYLFEIVAKDWCNPEVLINSIPTESFEKLTCTKIKENLISFFHEVAAHTDKTFIQDYAKKCQDYFNTKQGDKMLVNAVKNRSTIIRTEALKKRIEQEKQSADLEGELNGIKLSRFGLKKYAEEIDRALQKDKDVEEKDNTPPTNLKRTETVEPPALTITSDSETEDGADEDLTGETSQNERAVMALDMESDIVKDKDELPIPLVKEFYEWMYALILGKEYKVKKDALDIYEWDKTSPRDAMNQAAYVLLSQYNSKCNLDFCALQLSLSYIVNLANEEMKSMILPCLSGTSVEQLLYTEVSGEATTSEEDISEQNDEYNCIDILGEKICQFLLNKKEKDVNKRYKESLQCVNQLKCEYLKNNIDCLELQVLDVYEYLLRNIYKFEDLHIDTTTTESDFFNAIYDIIRIVIRQTKDLKTRSGEGACHATKEALALLKNKFDIQNTQRVYGRKIDLMFVDQKHKMELCSAEWKKRNVSLDTLLCQQTKNLRVSKCIFKKIAELDITLPELQSLSIDVMDWHGFDGYILQMRNVDGIYVASLCSTLNIPTHPNQMKYFKDTLKSLFKWKDRLVDLQDIISSAKANSSSSNSLRGIIKARKRSPSPDDYTFFSPKKSR